MRSAPAHTRGEAGRMLSACAFGSESSSVFLSLTSRSEVYRGCGAWKVVPRSYRAGRSPCPTTFTSKSISGAKTTVTSASVWYSSSGSRFHQPSGWQIKEKMIPGQLVTLQWDNGCFCYSFFFFFKEKEEEEEGEKGGGEGKRWGRKRRRGWGEEGGREGGRKGQHPCGSRGNTCPPPWHTPDSASLPAEMLPVEGGGPA